MRIVVKVGTHAIAAKSGRPDHAALKKEAGIFARWIARQHEKERAATKAALA